MNATKVLVMTITSRQEFRETVTVDASGRPGVGEVGHAISHLAGYVRGHCNVDPASVEFYWEEETTNGCTPDGRR